MLIKTRVLDESLNTVFQAHTKISVHNLIEVAKSRDALARSKGPSWAADAIPVFGKMLINLMRLETLGDEVDNAAIQVAMAAWLYDSITVGWMQTPLREAISSSPCSRMAASSTSACQHPADRLPAHPTTAFAPTAQATCPWLAPSPSSSLPRYVSPTRRPTPRARPRCEARSTATVAAHRAPACRSRTCLLRQ